MSWSPSKIQILGTLLLPRKQKTMTPQRKKKPPQARQRRFRGSKAKVWLSTSSSTPCVGIRPCNNCYCVYIMIYTVYYELYIYVYIYVYVSTYNWNFTPKYPMDNLFVFRLAVEWGTTQDFLASKIVPWPLKLRQLRSCGQKWVAPRAKLGSTNPVWEVQTIRKFSIRTLGEDGNRPFFVSGMFKTEQEKTR